MQLLVGFADCPEHLDCTSHHITSHHITSHHITSHHITSHHITSHHVCIALHDILLTTLHCISFQYITLHYQQCESDPVCWVQEAQKEYAKLSSQMLQQSSQAGHHEASIGRPTAWQEAKRQADQVGCIPSSCAEARLQSLTHSQHVPMLTLLSFCQGRKMSQCHCQCSVQCTQTSVP